MGSGLVNPVDSRLTCLHCFYGELGMPSSQHLVGWLTGSASTNSCHGTFTFFLFQFMADGQWVILE